VPKAPQSSLIFFFSFFVALTHSFLFCFKFKISSRSACHSL
jgi:hypothetical protein